MNREIDVTVLRNELKKVFPDKNIVIDDVLRRNTGRATGVMINDPGLASSCDAVFYLENFKDCKDESEIAKEIYKMRATTSLEDSAALLSSIKDFNFIKDNLILAVCNYDKNIEFLADKPHIRFLNLAVYFCAVVLNGEGTLAINNKQMLYYNTDKEQLLSYAIANTKKQISFLNMNDLLNELVGNSFDDNFIEADNLAMYVLTNHNKHYGASSIFIEQTLSDIAKKLRHNFYVLPSSIHEVIIVPDLGLSTQELLDMVIEINATQLSEKDFLADSVYLFNAEDSSISLFLRGNDDKVFKDSTWYYSEVQS